MKFFNFKINNLIISEYGWKELKRKYKKYTSTGLMVSALIHMILILIYFSFQTPEVRKTAVLIKTELRPPPLKFNPKAPRLSKNYDVSKEPESPVALFTPRDINPQNIQTTSTPPPSGNYSSSRGSEGSVFYGALTSGEASAEGWGIPAGATSYGRRFDAGGSGGYGAGFEKKDFGPDINTEIINTRTSASGGTSGLSKLKEDLIDYTNFKDRFYGWVEQGKNKKDIKGFLEFYQLQYRGSKVEANNQPGWNCLPQAMMNLADYINSKTNVKVTLKGSVRLDAKELYSIPILFMIGYSAEPIYTKEEAKNLGKYLREGGFLFIDDAFAYESASFNQKSRQLIKDALGFDAVFEKLSASHPLFRAWEDFNNVPAGDDNIRPNGMSLSSPNPAQLLKPVAERYKYIEGVFLNGRLAVILSSKGYSRAWADWLKNPSSFGGPQDNTRQLQFGLNIIVFSSTQKGGIIDRNKQKVASEANK